MPSKAYPEKPDQGPAQTIGSASSNLTREHRDLYSWFKTTQQVTPLTGTPGVSFDKPYPCASVSSSGE